MSIKGKIIVVVALSLVAGAAVVGYLFDRSYRQNLQWTADEALRSSREAFQNLRQDSIDMMAAAVEALGANETVNAAFARRDREGLLAVTEPMYKSYNKRYGVTHWNYWEAEPEGQREVKGLVNFLRAATPKKYGEMLERATLAEVAKTKTFVDGLDLGNTGFALRVVHPLYHQGKLAGYFEIGKDIGNFLDSMKRQTGNEYGLVLVKAKLDEKKWESSRTSRGLKNNWNDMSGLVLAKNTSQEETIFKYEGSLEGIEEKGENLGFLDQGDQVFNRGAFPLYDAGGAKVGAVFVLTNVTEIVAGARQAQIKALATMVGLMFLTGLMMCMVFNRLIVRRLERLIAVATRVVGGEFQLPVIPSANDEIGKFERLFEQFRTVFVDLVASVHRLEQPATVADSVSGGPEKAERELVGAAQERG